MNILSRPRRAPLALLAVISLAPLTPFSQPAWAQGWKSLAPRGGGFSALMPGAPKAERKVSKDKDGAQTVDQDYELETAEALFKIGYQEHDAQMARGLDIAALLDEVAKAAVKEMGGQNVKPRPVTLNGFPGRDVTAQVDQGGETGTVRLRVFWAGRRLYLQMAAFADSPQNKADADKFVSSLKLLKPQPK